MLGRLLRHTSVYTFGNILLMLAGFVSFPILTRLLSVGDYGVLSLIGTTLALLVAVGKLGMQQSVVRFHADLYTAGHKLSEAALFSTVLWGMGLTGTLATIIWVVLILFAPTQWWHDPRLRLLMLMTAVLILVRTLESALLNLLRAQQRSGAYTTYSVVRRYVLLAITLGTMLYLIPGLNGFYGSTVIGEALSLCALGGLVLHRRTARLGDFSPDLMRAMLAFGLPMMGYELAGSVLNVGDRYVIQVVLGSKFQGVYSAAYSVAEYVQAILVTALSQALIPIYTRLWIEEGERAVRTFIDSVLHFYLLFSAATIGGLAMVGNSLVGELATARYKSDQILIPVIMAGLICEGAIPMLGAGLFMQRRKGLVLPVVITCAVFNVVVGALAARRLGLMGAALAMLVSYIILLSGFAIIGGRYLKIKFPAAHALKSALLAVAMCAAISCIDITNEHLRLAARVLAGAAVFAVLALLFDRRCREAVAAAWRRYRHYLGKPAAL